MSAQQHPTTQGTGRRLTTWPHPMFTRVTPETWAELQAEVAATGDSLYLVVRSIIERWAARREAARSAHQTPGPVAGREPRAGRKHGVPTRVDDSTWAELATAGREPNVALCIVLTRWATSRRARRARSPGA
jgi:hypothetical protein